MNDEGQILQNHARRGWRVVVPLLLILAALVLGAWNAHWRAWNHLDELPEQWDEAHFTAMSIRINDKMRQDPAKAYDYFIHGSPNQAPFISLAASFLYYVFPRSARTALDFNIICLAVLLISVYFLGARRSPTAGLLAAITTACMMPVLQYMRLFRTELPMAALVALAILCIEKSDRFKSFLPTLAAGVLCGVAMLTNPIALVFILAPVLYALLRGLIDSRLSGPRLVNFGVGLFAAFLIASVWYLPNQEEIRRFLLGYGFGAQGEAYRSGHPWFTLYPQLILRDIGWPLSLSAVIAVILAAASAVTARWKIGGHPRQRLDLWLILCWVFAAYFLLNFTRDQQTRFLLPLLPGAAVLLGVAIASIRWKALFGAAAVFLLLACAGALYAAFTQPLTQIREVDITQDRDWQLKAIAEKIAEDAGGKPVAVAFLANHALFTAKGFDLAALLDRRDFKVNYLGEEITPATIDVQLSQSDYLVLKTGRQMEDNARHLDVPVDVARKEALRLGYGAKPFQTFTLPDRSEALLYKREKR
jgi:hypothetical protein